ncbi:hypothetical protein ES705_25820 [subsurface metagenome]
MKNYKVFVLMMCLFLIFSSFMISYAQESKATEVKMAAGGIGGSWFVMSTALFKTFSTYIDDFKYTIVPGGGVANPIAIKNKDVDFALVYTTNLWSAYHGGKEYNDTPIEQIRGIARLGMADVVHNFILSKKGINSIKEIYEKKPKIKLDTGTLGLAGELAVSRMLELHGITYEDIKSWGGNIIHSSYSEAVNRLRDTHIDGFFNNELIGKPLFVELTQSTNVNLLPQEEGVVKQMIEKYGYNRAIIPAGTYEGQEKDILTTSQEPVLVVDKDVDEELVYQMTKLIFEYRQELINTYAPFKNLDIKNAVPTQAPLHPGALRYYKEKGIL